VSAAVRRTERHHTRGADGRQPLSSEHGEAELGGESIEWGADGSTTVTEHVRGQKEGISWRLDERGTLVLVEQWRGGVRNGRSCTWREGRLDVDRVWAAGEPAPAG